MGKGDEIIYGRASECMIISYEAQGAGKGVGGLIYLLVIGLCAAMSPLQDQSVDAPAL